MSNKGKRGRLSKRNGFGRSVDRRLHPKVGRRKAAKRLALIGQYGGR